MGGFLPEPIEGVQRTVIRPVQIFQEYQHGSGDRGLLNVFCQEGQPAVSNLLRVVQAVLQVGTFTKVISQKLPDIMGLHLGLFICDKCFPDLVDQL